MTTSSDSSDTDSDDSQTEAHSIPLVGPRRRGGGSTSTWRGPRYIAPDQGQGACSVDMFGPSSPRPTSYYFFKFGVAVVLFAVLVAREADSRLPPKLLKVALGTRKALYARGYAYNLVPIPTNILLSANYARREVHGPRPPKQSKRPPRRNKRPPPEYAPKFRDYRPVKKRRPPQYPELPDYYDQDLEEEYDYEDHSNRDYEDFVPKRSEQYNKGHTRRTKPKRYQDEITAYTENIGPVYARRPLRNWRPSTKLYSAAIGGRPQQQREEHNDFEDYRDVGMYVPTRREKLEELRRLKEKVKKMRESYDGYNDFRVRPQVNWDPDNIYHDRNYDAMQDKFRQEALVANERTKQQPKRNTWFVKNGTPDEEENSQPLPTWTVETDRNKWKGPSNQNRWKNPDQPSRGNEQKRWNDPGPKREDFRGQSQAEEEPDIITSQNAEAKTTEIPEYMDWVKEHSVGYGIEMESYDKVRKKMLERDPDVVYGQAGYTKPRIPDIGYGHGLEVISGKVDVPQW